MEQSVLFSTEQIRDRVQQLGSQITKDYPKEIFCVGVLKGSIVFFADLIRSIQTPMNIDFMGLKSYEGNQSSGNVRITSDLHSDIKGKDVLIIEDIVDTGITMDFLLDTLRVREPHSIEICTLLSKPDAHILKHNIKYTGFEISNEFVVGYGLDLDGYHRNIPHISQLTNISE